MSEKDYKYKVIRELQFVSEDNSFSDAERDYARKLGNNLVDKGEAEVKKILYASFNDPQLYNVTKAVASALKEDTEIGKVTKATTKAPVYNTKVGEMFAKFGGDEILDERSPKYWAKDDSEVDDRVISDIADEYGMPKQDLYKMLQDESVKERNRQIFSGTDLGSDWSDRLAALGLKFVAPRTMESLEQGKGFVPADVAKDVAENIVYSLNPVAKASQFGVRTLGRYAPKFAEGKLAKYGTNIATSFGTPAIVEVSDKIVDEAIDEEKTKSSKEIVQSIFGSGIANYVYPRKLKMGLAKTTGANAGVRKELAELGLDASEEAAKDTKKLFTAKDFIDETEKALKQREKVQKKIEQKGRGVKPSEQEVLNSVTPIITGSGSEMNAHATEIAKMMAKQDLSLEEATAKYFEKIRKKMGDDEKFAKYIDDFKYVIPNEDKKVKTKEFGYDVVIGDDGLVHPTKRLEDDIKKSSWGQVFTKKFDKPKRETPVRESFIGKTGRNLARLGLQVSPYVTYKISKPTFEGGQKLVFGSALSADDNRNEKLKQRKEEAAEKKARSRYVFNPYKTEEKKEKPRGIRAYIRGEAERPTQEEVERAIARKLGIDMGE